MGEKNLIHFYMLLSQFNINFLILISNFFLTKKRYAYAYTLYTILSLLTLIFI